MTPERLWLSFRRAAGPLTQVALGAAVALCMALAHPASAQQPRTQFRSETTAEAPSQFVGRWSANETGATLDVFGTNRGTGATTFRADWITKKSKAQDGSAVLTGTLTHSQTGQQTSVILTSYIRLKIEGGRWSRWARLPLLTRRSQSTSTFDFAYHPVGELNDVQFHWKLIGTLKGTGAFGARLEGSVNS